jgi:GntR family transcriptional regulator
MRRTSIPLYAQVMEEIRAWIRTSLSPGEKLPSETELCDRFRVSRATVRRALTELRYEGYLTSHQGKGTFVARTKIRLPLARLRSFTEDMTRRGLVPGSRVLRQMVCPAPPDSAAHLGLAEGDPVVLIERLRLADGEPMALEEVAIPQELAPGLERVPLEGRSLYAVLEQRYGLILGRAEQSIEAGRPTAEERRLLELPPAVPVLRLERLTFLSDGRPVEFVRSAYRGDRYRFSVELER